MSVPQVAESTQPRRRGGVTSRLIQSRYCPIVVSPGARSSAGQSNGFLNRLATPVTHNNQTTSNNREIGLADCLAFLEHERPDFVPIVRAWDRLPAAVRAGILAMVQASATGATP